MSASYSVHNANFPDESLPLHRTCDAVVTLDPYRPMEDVIERDPRKKLRNNVFLFLFVALLLLIVPGAFFLRSLLPPMDTDPRPVPVNVTSAPATPNLTLEHSPLNPYSTIYTPVTKKPMYKEDATTTPSRTKREHNEVEEEQEEQSFSLEQVEEIAQAVLDHDVSLQQAHLDGFRAAGLPEATLSRLQRQLTRTELKKRRKRTTISDYATSAGIEALKFAFKSFDLVPKAYKKTSHNPGYEVGVPSGHARTLRQGGFYGNQRSPYSDYYGGYPGGANTRGLAVGELSGRRASAGRYSGYGGYGANVPITTTF